jgi:2Fe-2S ferredoxin
VTDQVETNQTAKHSQPLALSQPPQPRQLSMDKRNKIVFTSLCRLVVLKCSPALPAQRALRSAWALAHFLVRGCLPTSVCAPLPSRRSLNTCLTTPLRKSPGAAAKKTIQVTFVKPDGSKQTVSAPVGDSMLEVAHANKIDIEGASSPPRPPQATISHLPCLTLPFPCPPLSRAGACGGETACSTCHLYIDEAFFKKLPAVSEAEEDMLDLAAGLKDNRRLGCQVFAAANLDGMVVHMPKEVNNLKG